MRKRSDDRFDSDEDTPDETGLNRRTLVAGAAAIGAFAGLHTDTANAAKPPEKMKLQPGDRIQFIKGPNKGEFLRPELLVAGEKPVEAFPFAVPDNVVRRKYRLNRLLTLKLNPSEMNEDTRARSVDGVLVFSALCTHRACTIKSWMAEERFLRCHCHLSRFAALEEGRVMNGPAKRQLPMVPITLDEEGFVVAATTFTGKPGGAKK